MERENVVDVIIPVYRPDEKLEKLIEISTFIAVSVNCYNSIGVLINYDSIRIHTEGSY